MDITTDRGFLSMTEQELIDSIDAHRKEEQSLGSRISTKLARLQYKPGYRFSFSRGSVEIEADVPDAYNPGSTFRLKFSNIVGIHELRRMADDDAVFLHLIHWMIENMERHEIGEFLQFDGERPFDPHKPPRYSNLDDSTIIRDLRDKE